MAPPPMPPEMQAKMEGMKRIADAIRLIRDERMRGFRVDIEVDSTVFGDSQQEKADRIEFIEAVTKFLSESVQLSAAVPEITPLLGKFLQFGVRGFHVGRDLESAIEEFCDSAAGTAKERAIAQQNKPNPQLITAQASMISAQSKMKAVDAKSQGDNARLAMDSEKTHAKMAQDSQQAQAEVQRQQVENAGEAANSQADIEMKKMEMSMKQMDMEIQKIKLQIEYQKLLNPPEPPPSDSEQGAA